MERTNNRVVLYPTPEERDMPFGTLIPGKNSRPKKPTKTSHPYDAVFGWQNLNAALHNWRSISSR